MLILRLDEQLRDDGVELLTELAAYQPGGGPRRATLHRLIEQLQSAQPDQQKSLFEPTETGPANRLTLEEPHAD